MGRMLQGDQFRDFLARRLGPEAVEPDGRSPHPLVKPDGTPNFDPSTVSGHVFRTMSEQHYRQSLRSGFHSSDERGNYIGQAKENPELWGDEKPWAEGTVAGRWAYPGYIQPGQVGRVVKVRVHPEDGWRPHPDDDEGGWVHTYNKIPTDRFEAVTPPLRSPSRGWGFEVVNGRQFR